MAEAVIRPDLGAGLAAYDLLARGRREPLFRRAPPDAIPFQLAHNVLIPWSGRISGGGFAFDGRFWPLAPNLAGEAFPIHGNGFTAAWTVEAVEAASARLTLRSDGPGPYRYDATASYALDDGALTIALSMVSRADRALPCGLGLHPWLPRTPQTMLRAVAQTVWFEDEHYLPAGSGRVGSCPEWDFTAAHALPLGWINNCFTGWDGEATITWPERHLTLDVTAAWPLTAYIVYSPGAPAGFFCFEPVSHPVDAHNLPGGPEAHGLVVLAPGEQLSAAACFTPRAL